MSCPDLEHLIHERLDGNLAEGEGRLLDAHLSNCAPCREEELRLRELVGSLAALPEESEPSRDLWPGLRARLVASSAVPTATPSRDIPWLRLAAAGLLLTLLVGSQGLLPEPPASETKALSDEHQQVFAEYERASAALIESLEGRRDDLSPATLDTIDSNLALIENALKRTREALQASPNDSDLRELHYALLGRKTSVLQDLVQLPNDRSVNANEDR